MRRWWHESPIRPRGTAIPRVLASGERQRASARLTVTTSSSAGELIDLRRPLDHNVKLQILTEKDPDSLYVFRHSAAHLLAAAVMELYPM